MNRGKQTSWTLRNPVAGGIFSDLHITFYFIYQPGCDTWEIGSHGNFAEVFLLACTDKAILDLLGNIKGGLYNNGRYLCGLLLSKKTTLPNLSVKRGFFAQGDSKRAALWQRF